jgi:transcriptional regulator with GAF, ATPase, and Fis domain
MSALGPADPRRPHPGQFQSLELDALQAFASLAAATVTVAERIEHLALRAEDEHQRAEIYRQASGQDKELIGQSPRTSAWWKKSAWSAAAT